MLYSNGFSVELSSFEVNIEKEGLKEVERNMTTLVIQLTQVLMSRIVAGLCMKALFVRILSFQVILLNITFSFGYSSQDNNNTGDLRVPDPTGLNLVFLP